MSEKRIVIFGYSSSIHIKKWALSLSSRNYKVLVISLDGEDIPGIDVVRFKRIGKFSYFIHASKAAKTALAFMPDIIHVHYAGGYGIWGVKTKIHPMAVSIWGSDIETLPKSIFYRPLIKSTLKYADIITTTSDSLKKATTDFYDDAKSKTVVIPFGVQIPEKAAEFPKTDFVSAIYLKHLEAIYAPDILIQAVALVHKKIPTFRLAICGSGSMKSKLKQLVKELHLDKNIVFTGYIDNAKIYKVIQQHHFMIMPSLQEGFGVAAVEAFACSRPVVATKVGGIPEIITDGQNGYLVEPNNVDALAEAMIKMISDRERMIQMGRNGYEVAKQKFDWKKSVDQMIELYEKLL